MASSGANLILYLIIRKDLITLPGWSVGSVITQGAHAATLCLETFKNDENVKSYLEPQNLPNMRKVTLEAKDEKQLQDAATKLRNNNIDFVTWVEDGMDVCLATKPISRETAKPALGRFKLLRDLDS